MATPRNRPAHQGQGMQLIRPDKRLALYLRDGLACAFCGAALEDGAHLTLDQLVPQRQGGTNAPTNLVTCCSRCRSHRGCRDWQTFAGSVAAYINHGVDAADICAHILTTVQRPVDMAAAKQIKAARGGFTALLHTGKRGLR
jgi:hypothetical protein